MKFPQLVIEQKEYEKHLAELLEDPDCLLLFDTNILSQMFSLHQAARKGCLRGACTSTPTRGCVSSWTKNYGKAVKQEKSAFHFKHGSASLSEAICPGSRAF